MQEQAVSMVFLEKRKTGRVSDAMALRVQNASEAIDPTPLVTTPTHVVNISMGGLSFLHDTSLPTNESLFVTLCLGPQHETVSLNASVVSSVEASSVKDKRFDTHVEFKDVDKTAQDLLDQHIRLVLKKTYKHRAEFHYKASA